MTDAFIPTPFRARDMMDAVADIPYSPGLLGRMGLYNPKSLTTTVAQIHLKDGVIKIVPVTPRGTTGLNVGSRKRRALPVNIPHMQEEATVLADEVQNVTSFNSETRQLLTSRRNDELAQMESNIEYSVEAHRMYNILGTFIDNNNDITSTHTLFGLPPQTTIPIDLSTPTSADMRVESFRVLSAIRKSLGGIPFSGVKWLHSEASWEKLLTQDSIKQAVLNSENALQLADDPRQIIRFGGISHEWYDGTSDIEIPANESRIFPMGVRNMFQTYYAPADWIETVNRSALRAYAKTKVLDYDTGWEMIYQTNQINLCTRPASIFRSTTP